MKHLLLLLLFLTTSFTVSSQETHVFLLAGQSNMVGRADYDGNTPHPPGTLQWNSSNNTLIPASIPMLHHDARAGDMGLEVQFAIDYKAANPNVTLVLIPRAKGGTGFNTTGQWRVGDALYNSAVNETNACMAANPSFIFKGILWHQGERDRNNIPAYYAYYDNLINSMRNDINAADATTPFICGGIMPDFISNNAGSDIDLVQAYLEDTPNRIQYTAYADNAGLTTFDGTHGDAASLRVFGTRYFQQLSNAVNNKCTVTTEFVGGSWDNGDPDANKNVIFSANYDIPAANLEVCTCELTNNAIVTVGAGKYLKVEEGIVVNSGATLLVEHTGSVVQTNADALVVNNGTINVELTTPFLKPRDFMIMGSPMTQETRDDVFTNAFLVLNHTTANFFPHPDVAAQFPLAENFADDTSQNGSFWNQYSGSINVGRGYLVRPQADYQDGNKTYDMTYTQGTLNNGDITFNVIFNNNKNDSPNVLANPYASSIWANDFITANSMVDELYFWEHITTPNTSLPGSGSMNFSMEDISMYNLIGGTPAASDPGTSTTPNGYISTGQGFGIKANASGTATFTNSMRRTTDNNTLRGVEIIRDRLWLTVSNDTYEMQNTTLIGFTREATAGFDNGFDSRRLATVVSLFSHLEDGIKEFGIQTREEFDVDQKIPLGFSTLIDEELTYTISIHEIDGINLDNASVYLFDKLLNTMTNLSETDYEFRSSKESYSNRFVLMFKDKYTFDDPNQMLNAINLYPNPASSLLNIDAPLLDITRVEVFDLSGRKMSDQLVTDSDDLIIDMSSFRSALYFVKITTDSGTVTKRIQKN
jgi:hypothetical protein